MIKKKSKFSTENKQMELDLKAMQKDNKKRLSIKAKIEDVSTQLLDNQLYMQQSTRASKYIKNI